MRGGSSACRFVLASFPGSPLRTWRAWYVCDVKGRCKALGVLGRHIDHLDYDSLDDLW